MLYFPSIERLQSKANDMFQHEIVECGRNFRTGTANVKTMENLEPAGHSSKVSSYTRQKTSDSSLLADSVVKLDTDT